MARNSAQVLAGPGLLYVAPVGTAEPTSASAALDAAFREVGYTTEGTTVTYEITSEAIEVAEEFDPIRYQTTGRNGTVSFAMAQSSISNLALALNQGAAVADNPGSGIEPPEPGAEVRVMMVLQTETGARWIFRQLFNASSIEIAKKKSPNLSTIPVEFKMEKPTNKTPFKVFADANGNV